MDEDQITVLAREYAEEENPIESYSDTMFERAIDLSISRGEALRVLTWLTRRYCLVEKIRLIEEYKFATANFNNASDPVIPTMDYYLGIMKFIESLFPEIVKEVEE